MGKDTHHTGYKKLIQLDVGSLSLSIMGEDRDVPFPSPTVDEDSFVKISLSGNNISFPQGSILTLAEEDEFVCTSDKGVFYLPYRPLFFEQVNYTIYAEMTDSEDKLDMWHINQNIRNKIIRPSSKKKNVMSGSFNFGSDIGFSDFVFKVNGEEYITLTIEVFPSKISYKKDYEQIRDDITNEIYALIFDTLKKTYINFKLTAERKSTKLEFYAIFQMIFSDFIKAIDCIIRAPHHQLMTEHEIVPARKAKRIDSRSMRWLENHPENVRITGSGRMLIDKVNAVKKYVTFDTKENRIARHMIDQTLYRVVDFERSYKELTTKGDSDENKREEDKEFVAKIERQIGIIRNRQRSSFLNEIQYNNETVSMSLVFSMAPGYRELFRCYLKMQQALEIFNDIFHMSQKDLATLYEYWCFIKLNAIVRRCLEDRKKIKPKTNTNQLIMKLKKGENSEITYEIPDSDEKIVLSYNPKRKHETGPQKPDNVLSIKKHGDSGVKYEYVFDAKYKIDTRSFYAKANGPGPEEEDINTMHRYRDAIVSEVVKDSGVFRREMYGAYILFPFEDVEEKYKNHPFFISIQKVNIGGFPFLPSQTSYVEEQIEKLLQGVGNAPDEDLAGEMIPLELLEDRTEEQSRIIAAYLAAMNSDALNRPK